MTQPLSPLRLKQLMIRHDAALYRCGIVEHKAEALRVKIAELAAMVEELQRQVDLLKNGPVTQDVTEPDHA